MSNKSRELTMLEESLRNFIIEEYLSDEREKIYFNAFKYKGLTVMMDNFKKGFVPLFSVQIAMLQAEFSIETGKKIGGGLGVTDERMIERWLEHGINRHLMTLVWEGKGKIEEKHLKIRPFDMD